MQSGVIVRRRSFTRASECAVAGPDSVVISWVTFGDDGKFTPPTATVNGKIISGVTHTHRTAAGDRTYFMHFVRVGDLERGKHTLTLSNLDRAAP